MAIVNLQTQLCFRLQIQSTVRNRWFFCFKVHGRRTEEKEGEYWLSDEAWVVIDPLLPKVYAGARRKDDRRVISGIIHVLRSGCRWRDRPSIYGPPTTIYNRFNRWSGRALWQKMFDALAKAVPNDTRLIDSTSIKVQRAAVGGNLSRSAGTSRPGCYRPSMITSAISGANGDSKRT
jgi:transposase